MISSNISFISSEYQIVENGRERNPSFEDSMIKIVRPEDKSIMHISINPSMSEMRARLEEIQSIFAPEVTHRQDVKTADVLKYIGDDSNYVFYVRNKTHIIVDPFSITAKYKSMAELSFAEDQDLMVIVEKQDADLMIKYYKRENEIVDNKYNVLPKQDKDINAEKWQLSNNIRKPILINKQKAKQVPKQTTQKQQPKRQATAPLKVLEFKTYYKDLSIIRVTTEKSSLVHFEYKGNKISKQYNDCIRPIRVIPNIFFCTRTDNKRECLVYDYRSHCLNSTEELFDWTCSFSTINLDNENVIRKGMGNVCGSITTSEIKSAKEVLNISTNPAQMIYAYADDNILLVDKNAERLKIYKCPLSLETKQVKVKEEENKGISGCAISVIVAIGVFSFFLCIWKGGSTVFQALVILILELVVGFIWVILVKENLKKERKGRMGKKKRNEGRKKFITINTNEAKVIYTNHDLDDK